MSYWRSDNVVHIGEEQVEIPAERGLQYVVGQTSRKVVFKIPQSLGIFSGKDSYLSWDMKILNTNVSTNTAAVPMTAGSRTRLQLDPAGGGMMVQNMRLMNNGVVIEELNEYNQLVALKHDYDRDEALLRMKSQTEGATCYNSNNAGTLGSSKSEMCDLKTNPWFKETEEATQNVNYDAGAEANVVKCCVPLMGGVFSGGAFPLLLLENGLTLELDLAPAQNIVRQLDSVVRNRRRTANPRFAGANALGVNTLDGGTWTCTNGNALVAGAGQRVVREIFLTPDNSMRSIRQCPFVVGERIGFAKINDAAKTDGTTDVAVLSSTDGGGPGPNAKNGCIIAAIDQVAIGGTDHIRLTLAANTFNTMTTAAGGDSIDNTWCVCSLAADNGKGAAVAGIPYSVSYQVDNLNLVVHKLELEQSQVQKMLSSARDGSAIEFDIMSATNYKNSLLASERQASFLINAKNSRAKSILTLPTDSTIYANGDLLSSRTSYEVTRNGMDTMLKSERPSISGCCDFLTEYQFQISGINVPSRPVSTRKIATRNSIDAFFLFELEKALANSDIDPRSFSKYMENFSIGRSFGTFSGAQNLQNEDLTIVLRYAEATAPTKPKMMSSFVHHVRRIRMVNGFVEIDQ